MARPRRTVKRARNLPIALRQLLADTPSLIIDVGQGDSPQPSEEELEGRLAAEERALNLAREAETRHLLGSSPLVPTDLWELLPSGDGCSPRVDR